MDEDYYSTVYTWFDKCGIISNMRTQLRHNLVNVLKHKDLSLNQQNKGLKFAKQYVYDLLIAEYLFSLNYAYTLSVFASEAPLLNNFNNQQTNSTNSKFSKQKLRDDFICHTLETLGIQPNNRQGQFIISNYADSDIPLLLCILKCVTSSPFETSKESVMDNPVSLSQKYTQTNFYDSIKTKKLSQHKQSSNLEWKKRETALKEQSIIVEQQLSCLNEKLKQVQNLMQSLNTKEKLIEKQNKCHIEHIKRKEIELSVKENFLIQETERLQKERDSDRKFEYDLKKLQEELVKIQKELPSGKIPTNTSSRDIHVQTNFESFMSPHEEIEHLMKEKLEFRNLIKEQKSRIEQLTLRAVQLTRKLEEAHLLKLTSKETPLSSNVHANTIVSESSSTEDILQDAKMRLKRLEEESLKADQYYYNYIITPS